MTTQLLTGARLADGTGQPLRHADVGVDDGVITAVEPPGTLPVHDRAVRDLSGLVLAPGFIDVHSHADNAPLLDHDDSTKILQGVTTEVVGNCGFSLAPSSTAHADTLTTFLRRLFPPLPRIWHELHDLLTDTDTSGYVTNYCPLVGHGTLRIAAMGMTDQRPDRAALSTMCNALEESMAAGAFGLSSGLIYPPSVFAETAELLELARTLGGDGLYTTHMRNEGDTLLESIREALRIGRAAGRTHLSHLKAAGQRNWGKMPSAIDALRRARAEGERISQDVYPYTASSTMLSTLLPPEFLAADADTIIARLAGPGGRAELAEALLDTDWRRVLIATTASHRDEGRTIDEIARRDHATGIEAFADLLVREKLRVAAVLFSMHEDDLRTAMIEPATMIGSDGLPPGTGGKPHPRLYGTFPRVLGGYCREHGVLGLPDAIRRMTSLPAHTFRIPARGRIAPGYVADLVAIDADTVTDVGDYRDPVHSPQGIEWVCLAGRTVVRKGTYLGPRQGRRLMPAA